MLETKSRAFCFLFVARLKFVFITMSELTAVDALLLDNTGVRVFLSNVDMLKSSKKVNIVDIGMTEMVV